MATPCGVVDVEDKLVNVHEVAERLAVSVRQVWKLASAGRMPSPVRLARSVRWRESDVSRFIECGCTMAAFEAEGRAVPG